MTTTTTKVRIGTTFRSPLADGNPLWIVDRIAAGVAHCHVVNEPWTIDGSDVEYESDFAGRTDVFKTNAIEHTLSWSANVTQQSQANRRWWSLRTEGETLHYHNSFGRYVRCEVIEVTGLLGLKSIAMVGAWKKFDAFRVTPTGEVVHSHQAKIILDGGERDQAWQPSPTTIFEHPKFSRVNEDPRTLPALPLNPPEPTAEEAQRYADEAKTAELAALLTTYPRPGSNLLDPLTRLQDVATILNAYLTDRNS